MTDPREQAAIIKKHWVRLTRTCNNRCLFCLDSEAQNGAHIPLNHIFAELRKGRKSGANRAILSGGEPTLHPGLINIITTARKIGYDHIQIITNGRMFAYKNFLTNCLASGLSEVTFSIHGHTEKLHDRLTGVNGSYRQTMQALKNAFREKNLIVSVDIVVNKLNVKYLKTIIKKLINIGAREFDILHIIPFGRAWDNRTTLFYDIDKSLPFLRKAFQLSLDPSLHIWANRFPPYALEGFEHLMQHPNKFYEEIKARKEIFRQFLIKGKKMYCHGERCRYCFLENFCHDLITFKQDKKLATVKPPFCTKIGLKAEKYLFNAKTKRQIDDFFKFYMSNRFTIKSGLCASCPFDSECYGYLYETIRKHGFKFFHSVSVNDKIKYYLNKFKLSKKMKKILPIILNNPELSVFHTGFKLDTINLKNRCVIEIIGKIRFTQNQGLFHDILAIGRSILPANGFASLKKLRSLINNTNTRIGYSIRDSSPISIKVYILFDDGLKTNIYSFKRSMRQLGFNINLASLGQRKSILSLEFCKNLKTVSCYKAYDRLPVDMLEHNICKNAYYFIAYNLSEDGCLTSKKLYKIYDKENNDSIVAETKYFLDNGQLHKIVHEDFTGCEIDAVGLRLDDRVKDIYLKVKK